MNSNAGGMSTKLRNLAVVVVIVLVIATGFRVVAAGLLDPSAAPASTMNTLASIFGALASPSYDASAISASTQGSALQISRCIILRMTGSSCP